MQCLGKKVATKVLVISIVGFFLLGVLPLNSQCQEGPPPIPTFPPKTATPIPSATATPEPTEIDDEPTDETDTGRSRYNRVTPSRSTGAVNIAFIGEIALIALLLVGGLVGGVVVFRRRGMNPRSLRKLTYGEYQTWVLKKMRGTAASSMDSSRGIDGFSSVGHPLAIKQSDSVSMRDIDLFASSVARKKARNGVIVAFGFSPDAIRGKVRARRSYGLDIQMLTVDELLMSRNPL